jgi:hypothetical protein
MLPKILIPLMPLDKNLDHGIFTADGSMVFTFNSEESSRLTIETWKNVVDISHLFPVGWFRSGDSVWINLSNNHLTIMSGEDPEILYDTSIRLEDFVLRIKQMDLSLEEAMWK